MTPPKTRSAETRIDSVHEALRRLAAMRSVYRAHGGRSDSPHRYYDSGAARGLTIAIDEITEALKGLDSAAALRGVE